MDEPEILETANPEAITEPVETVEPTGLPTGPSEDDQDLADFQTAIERAETDEEKEKARTGFQKRRQEKESLREQLRKAEMELAIEKARRAALAPTPTEEPAIPPPPAPGPELPPAPRRSDFVTRDDDGFEVENLDAYLDARDQWTNKCSEIRWEWRQKQDEQQRTHAALLAERQTWEQKGETKVPGFLVKIQPLKDRLAVMGDMGNVIGIGVTNNPAGHEIAAYLAAKPQEIQRLGQMAPHIALMEIGVLGTKLAKAEPKKITDAPEPLTPLQPSDTTDGIMDNINDDEEWFRKYKQKKVEAKRGRR